MDRGRPALLEHAVPPQGADGNLAVMIRDYPAEAEDAEKSQHVLETNCCLAAEADEAERVDQWDEVNPPDAGMEADDEVKATLLFAPPCAPSEDED